MRFFFFNDTATTEIYTLSLHDALPIWMRIPTWYDAMQAPAEAAARIARERGARPGAWLTAVREPVASGVRDRKSTRLNSSHANISYAVFCLKKKNTNRHS